MMEEVGRIVPRALKKHVRRDEAPLLAVVTGLWSRVAGRAIAEQARPAAFSAGTLTLSSDSESWAVQLQALSGEICAAVNKALGQHLVKHLRVRLNQRRGSGVGEPTMKPEAPQVPPVAPGWPELQTGIDTTSVEGLDPEIRQALSHSFAKYFARAQQRIN
jgi:hypothetical protein